jgi:WD40 repeat protein
MLEQIIEKVMQSFYQIYDERLKDIYIPPNGGSRAQADELFPILDILESRFLDSDLRSLLLLGDSGMGKTTLCLRLCQLLWSFHENQQASPAAASSSAEAEQTESKVVRVPLYVHLPQYQEYLRTGLLEKVLQNLDLSGEERRILRRHPLLLVLDGYDELHEQVNIYEENQWDQHGYDIKQLISCRQQVLIDSNKLALFQVPTGNHAFADVCYEELYLQPFSNTQINSYLKKYLSKTETVSTHEASSSSAAARSTESDIDASNDSDRVNTFLTWLEQLPSLKALVTTPFLLYVTVSTLPNIVASLGKQGLAGMSARKITQNHLFSEFLKSWFDQQARRARRSGNLKNLSLANIAGYMQSYAQNLAASLLASNGQLNERALTDEETLKVSFLEPVKIHLPEELDTSDAFKKSRQQEAEYYSELLQRYTDSQYRLFFERGTDGTKTQTDLQRANLIAIREGCLLRSNGKTFKFIHKSITEYLAARHLAEGLLGSYNHTLHRFLPELHVSGLASQLLVNEPEILARLAEAAEENEAFKQLLEALIVATKKTLGLQNAAANAITVLNRMGTSFSGQDFKDIQIPGADLTGCTCFRTDFRGANLRGVKFRGAMLVGAQWQGAEVGGVDFGEGAYIKAAGAITNLHCLPSTNTSYLLAVGDGLRPPQVNQASYGKILRDKIFGSAQASYRSWVLLCYNLASHEMVTLNSIGTAFPYAIPTRIGKLNLRHLAENVQGAAGSYPMELCSSRNILFFSSRSERTAIVVKSLAGGETRIKGYSFIPLKLSASHSWLASYGYDSNRAVKPYCIALWRISGLGLPFIRFVDQFIASSKMNCMAISERTLATVKNNDILLRQLRVLQQSRVVNAVLRGHQKDVTSLVFINENLLASGSEDKTIRVWKLSTEDATVVLRGHEETVTQLAISETQWLVSADTAQVIRLWHLPNGEPGPVFTGHSQRITKLVTCQGQVYSSSLDSTIRVWPLPHCDDTKKFNGHQTAILSLAANRSDWLVAADGEQLRCWSRETGESDLAWARPHAANLTAMKYVVADDLLVYSNPHSIHDSIKCLRLPTFSESKTFSKTCSVFDMAINQEGWLLYGDIDEQITLKHITQEHTQRTWRVAETLKLAMSHKLWLLVISAVKVPEAHNNIPEISVTDNPINYHLNLNLWSLPQELTNSDPDLKINSTYCSVKTCVVSDGGWLAVSGASTTPANLMPSSISTWLLPSGQQSHLLSGHNEEVTAMDEDNENHLISASLDGTIRFWDVLQGQLLCSINLGLSISSIAYSSFIVYFGGTRGALGALDANEPQQPQLKWLRRGTHTLYLQDLDISETRTLSIKNTKLCQQRDTIGLPNPIAKYDPYCKLFQPIIGTAQPGTQPSLIHIEGQTHHVVSQDEWLVSIARSCSPSTTAHPKHNGMEHAYLILEGVNFQHRRFVIRAELFWSQSANAVSIRARSQTKKHQLDRLTNQLYEANQFQITAEEGHQLLQNIQTDQQRKLSYSKFGHDSIMTWWRNGEWHNCLTWCRKQLQNIGKELPTHWYNILVTFPQDVTLPAPPSAEASSSTAASP